MDTATFGTTTLIGPGGFVTKLTPAGTYLWAARLPGSVGEAISLDRQGNIYVTGSSSAGDAFVAKYGPSGALRWTAHSNGSHKEVGDGIAVDNHQGGVYVAGTFASPQASFGTRTILNSQPTDSTNDVFVAKLDTAGNWLWAVGAGGRGHDNLSAIKLDNAGNVYIGGDYDGPAQFGATTLPGAADLFVAKLNAAGAWQWAATAGGTDWEIGWALAVDASGNAFLGGSFSSPTMTVGSMVLTNSAPSGSTFPNFDLIVAKINSAGVWQWAASSSAPQGSDVEADDVAVDDQGNVYVGGWFYGNSVTFGSTTLQNAGGVDICVAKLSPTGTWQWATSAGGRSSDLALGLAIDRNGNVVVAGYQRSTTANFGSLTLHNPTPGNAICIARLGSVTGLPQSDATPPFTLAPNPAHHAATLSGAAPGTRFTVLDALGRPVLTAPADATGAATFDVHALPPGLYLVRADGRAGARRLVVE